MKPAAILVATVALAIGAEAVADTRVYDVDPAYRQEVLEILQNILDIGNPEYGGRAELLPTGQILVDTYSDERQAQIAEVLESIARSNPGPTPTVTLRFWVLHGVPGEDDAAELPSALGSVVRELEETYGDLGFSILDAASVSARSGEGAVFQNDRWEIYQEPIVSGDGDRLNAHVTIKHEYQELSVDLSLTKGEFVVLGSGSTEEIAGGGILALVVNWPAD